MTAQVTRQSEDSITIEVTAPLGGSMLQAEEAIQDGLNEVGLLATEEKRKWFDTDGSPIQLGSVRMTSKGQFSQDYETPFGIAASRVVRRRGGGRSGKRSKSIVAAKRGGNAGVSRAVAGVSGSGSRGSR